MRRVKKYFSLLPFCVPWAFLALYADAVYGWAWHYLVILVCMAVLAWRTVRTDGLLLTGNAVSLAVSLLCVCLMGFAEQSSYFKPFGAYGWAVVLGLFSALVQWLVWKRQWLILGLLTVLLGGFFGGAYWLLVHME